MRSLYALMLVAHRWIGLVTSLLLTIIGVTGAAYLIPSAEWLYPTLEQWHVYLMIPGAGQSIVIAATAAAIVLELTGLYLWWRRRIWTVRWRAGWRAVAYDLHHLSGVVLLAIMLLLAGTGLGRVALRQVLPQQHVIVRATNLLHTGRRFPGVVQAIYAVGGLGFVVQGVTGVMMWWPRRARSGRETADPGRIAG